MFTKLFDLIPVIEKIDAHFGHDNSAIESIEGSGNNLFVGTSTGGIISFSLNESKADSGKAVIRSTEWAKTILPQGRPVSQLKSASALNRLFALTDGVLHFLTMQDLQIIGGSKNRSISCFCLNECPNTDDPFSIELALGTRRRQILICVFNNDRFNVNLEIDTDQIPLCLAFDGNTICYGTAEHYYVVNVSKKSTKSLFPISNEQMIPVVKRIAKNEFLLNGMEHLGVFATGEGVSSRPPIFWSSESSVVSFAFAYPYVLSLSDQFVSVHSLLDQQVKQQFPFNGGRLLGDIDGQLFVVSRRHVFKVNPVSWEKQVDSLLADKLVDDALSLAQSARKPSTSKEDFVKIFKRLQQKAGFIKLEQCKWDEAFELFLQSKIDVREIICLFHDLLPVATEFVRSSPPLHNIPDIDFVVKRNLDQKTEAKTFLLNFLQNVRSESWTKPYHLEIETAVLKLSSEFDATIAKGIILNPETPIDLAEFEKWFKQNGYFGLQALALWQLKRKQDALNVWMNLIDGKSSDSSFNGGIDFLLDFLHASNSANLVYANFSWFFQHNMKHTLKVLSQYEQIDYEQIVKLLKDKHPDALRIYLEHLVFDQNSNLEKVHTQLAELYLSSLRDDMDERDELRRNFRQFLYSSSFYRSHYLMDKINEYPNLQYEKAILYGKTNEHAKAFDVLIDKLKNYKAAEEYCFNFTKNESREQRHLIYTTLLHTYLSKERGDNFVTPVLQLLNSRNLDVDFREVLELLPVHWSLSVMTPFLKQNTLKLKENVENLKFGVELAKQCNKRTNFDRRVASGLSYSLKENDRCASCQDYFMDTVCVVYPDGTTVHKDCVRYKHLSPSGRVFTNRQTSK